MLRRPFMTGIIIFLLLIGIGGAVLSYLARGVDLEVAAREKTALQASLDQRTEMMKNAVASKNMEQAALSGLERNDLSHIHQEYGALLSDDYNFEYVYVTDADGQLVYSSEFGQSGEQAHFQRLRGALEQLSRQAGLKGAGLALGPKDSALLVMHVFREESPHLNMPQPLRVFLGDVVDAQLLEDVASPAQLRGVQVLKDAPQGVSAGLEVPNLLGPAPALLKWDASAPGRSLLVRALLPMALIAWLLAVLLFVLMLRYRRLAIAIAQKEEQAREMAQSDRLTKLANREHFVGVLEEALTSCSKARPVALFFVDLDFFKDINDTSGHAAGDGILQAVAKRLNSCIAKHGVAARFGGDEFILFIRYEDKDEIAALAADIFSAIAQPVQVGEERFQISVSIGAACAPENAQDASELMRRADIALYRAKAEGRDTFRLFEPRFEQEQLERRRVERELVEALEKGELTVLYQPQVDMESERIVGFEALVRWDHPTLGRIRPDIFIPVAEKARLIHLVDAYVLNVACRDAQMLPNVCISVNMSPMNLRRPDIVESIAATLQSSGLDPSRLELELTESAILETGAEAMALLLQIRDLGVRLALDDFGTGHASLVHVRRFPISKIKIDKSFIFNLGIQKEAASIVEYVVRLGRSLGITLTAEGIENKEQMRFLRAFGAHQGQGYLFSPPLPLAAAAKLLEEQAGSGLSSPHWPVRLPAGDEQEKGISTLSASSSVL